jgi:hypothetical protein
MLKAWSDKAGPQLKRHWKTALGSPALVLIAASCVPAAGADAPSLAALSTAPALAAAPLAEVADQSGVQAVVGEGALAANASLPFADALNPAASAFLVRGATALDRLRSLDCLSQAIYYEAASESEDGQRAVAQVVLNRVRHPAWPNTVCGVVYQGPMRAGGGCQFTFTCDGSLARRPGGEPWLRARRLAAEALAGRIYAPVGLSTHYHTNYVFPAWAPRLAKTTVIGAHIFYRLPGALGQGGAFNDRYAGREPFPRPAMTMVRPAAIPAFASSLPADFGQAAPTARIPGTSAPRLEIREVETILPDSQVREEYRNSGQWRTDSPIAPPAQEASR